MDDVLFRAALVAGIVAAAVLVAHVRRRRQGRVRTGTDGRFTAEELEGVGLNGGDASVRALLVSSATCPPCRSVRQVLSAVARERPDFAWVSVDAADHVTLTRDHHVLRVPTLFVVDGSGRILARTSGVPATREIVRLVEQAENPLR
jgi:hypothetical protein